MTWRRRREGRLINTYIRGAAGDREAEGEDTMRGQDDDHHAPLRKKQAEVLQLSRYRRLGEEFPLSLRYLFTGD